MRKVYHQVGTIYGQPLLIEIPEGDDALKAQIYDFIKGEGNMPQYIAVDPRPHAKLFERLNPPFDMPSFDIKKDPA